MWQWNGIVQAGKHRSKSLSNQWSPDFLLFHTQMYVCCFNLSCQTHVTVLKIVIDHAYQIDNTTSVPTVTRHLAEVWLILWNLKTELLHADLFKTGIIYTGWFRRTVSICGSNSFGRVRDSSVGIAIRYGMDDPGIESRWGGGEIFSTRPDPPWGPPSLLYNGYRLFPEVKAAGAWCWPATPIFSAEVLNWVELYIYHP